MQRINADTMGIGYVLKAVKETFLNISIKQKTTSL